MYGYKWDRKTRGYKLTTETGRFVANEIRPVFAEELELLGFNTHFAFDPAERRPLMWAQRNTYLNKGELVARLHKTHPGTPPEKEFLCKPCKLDPVDVVGMVEVNRAILDALIADTLKRIKEMYESHKASCDINYIGFSGGKDSALLLDLCHRVLPLSVPVVFSDTDMELPDTYSVWEQIQSRYPGRPFIKVKAKESALANWHLFGPPSQTLRWCCSVHKSTPAILHLKEAAQNPSARLLAFVGVRGDESARRSGYDDVTDGMKNQNQVNAMPILEWGAHELFLYIFRESLLVNRAYRMGLSRVGCLLCPMSSERQTTTIQGLYSDSVSCFVDAVRQTISRDFTSNADLESFVFSGGWHARQSGVSLTSVIGTPSFEKQGDIVSLNFDAVKSAIFREWMKTLGRVVRTSESEFLIKKAYKGIDVKVSLENTDYITKAGFDFQGEHPDRAIQKWIRSVTNKSLGCVGCRACAAECPVGAISFCPTLTIDEVRCIHCMKCHSAHDGCLRFFSKRYAGGRTMTISGINKYMTFGLKPSWIATLASEREGFRSTTALGNRMIPSAITWFREAGLICASQAVQPTHLLDLGQRHGFESRLFWDLIWIGLINASPLIKWYVCNSVIGGVETQDTLIEKLSVSIASSSVQKGAMQSLCNTLKESPVGTDMAPIVQVETKGRRVLSLKRLPHSVEPLVILYGLYVMSQAADRRASFTVSEMMAADFESSCISPLVAFGMPVDEFKAQCAGLAERYPALIACSLTLGLDEVRIVPNETNLDNVIDLILA